MTKCWTRILLLVMIAILMQSGRAIESDNSESSTSSSVPSTYISSSSVSSTDISSSSVPSTDISSSSVPSTDISSSSVPPTYTSDGSSSSVESNTDSSDGSSSSDALSTDSVTLTSDSSTNPVESTTTDRPLLTGKELFMRTGKVLDDIDQSLDKLQQLLAPEMREKSHTGPLHLTGQKVNRYFRREDVGTKTEMCLNDKPSCIAIEQSCSDITDLTKVLADHPELWDDKLLSQLEDDSGILTDAVEEAKKEDFNVATTSAMIEDVKQQVSEGSRVASDQVEEYEKAEEDSIIFTSVFGTIGGLMAVGLLGTVIFAVVRGKKVSKTKEKKGYNQVREERIPVGDFLRAHDHPPPARSSAEASSAPHARSDYATPYAHDAPANRDPYARGRSPGEPRSSYAQGKSGGLTRHY
ncbi:agglutinin-like protein 5 isoform X2 [Penaeus chinensis]|uniref:agglutinin-like protein 5 isoform X2 n=1 Tax=Penaeus chinensis TaxID=139456 RepID=UPI001FB5AA29|nr:agglutinin-like protein 5 isoform X2 [Penaeus chinensis]